MNVWQKIRFCSAAVVQGTGWLFIVWASAMGLQKLLYPDKEIPVLQVLVGLANGFVFLLVGALIMLSIRRCVAETTFLLLTLPAFATCAILVSFYLYAFGG